MNWINFYGLIFIALIMIPNIVYAIKCKDGFENLWENKAVETFEQIGRYGCFTTMILNIPATVFVFWCDKALVTYLIVNGVLISAYCLIWIICFKNNSIFRALALSIIPSVIFLFSGIITRSVILITMAVIFAPCHIMISFQNAKREVKK